SVTPAVGLPDPSIAETNRAPPVERTLNSSCAVEAKSKFFESAHTNAPWWLAFARFPAARLVLPAAVLEEPPGTVASPPLAMFSSPPATEAPATLAVLAAPPATVD